MLLKGEVTSVDVEKGSADVTGRSVKSVVLFGGEGDLSDSVDDSLLVVDSDIPVIVGSVVSELVFSVFGVS